MRGREGQRAKAGPRATCLVCGCSMPYFLLKTVWISKATCQGSADAPATTTTTAPQDTRHDPSLCRRRLATLAAALENALAFTQAIAPARLDPLQQGLLHHGMQQLLCCMLARCQIPARRHRHHTRKQARRQRGGKARRQAGQAASSQQRLRLACFEIVGEQLLHRQAVDRRPDATMTQSASGTGQKTRGKRHETRDAKDAHLLY